MLARFAGRNEGVVLGLDPVLPVRPPRAGMLHRRGKPLPKIAHRLAAGPVLVFLGRRRVDDTGNVASPVAVIIICGPVDVTCSVESPGAAGMVPEAAAMSEAVAL